MDPTLSAIIYVVVLVFLVAFLMIVMSLIPALNQLKSLLKDLEKTSSEARVLTVRLKSIGDKVDRDLEKVDAIIDSTHATVTTVKESFKAFGQRELKPKAGLLAIIPAVMIAWDLLRRFKKNKNKNK